MLTIPTYRIQRSVKRHNVDLSVFCDWIEGSVLFQDDVELHGPDIIDLLIENHFYAEQGFAWGLLDDAWGELRRRQHVLGTGFPIEIGDRRLIRLRGWRDTPAYAFCLVLSFAKWYPGWASQFGKDYTEQGELFESLAKESLQRSFAGWAVHSTGWTRTQTGKLRQIVEDVAKLLSEKTGETRRWTKPGANDAGLDLVLFRSFPDNRVGIPVYLTQCASGGDWAGKLHTPNLLIWNRIIEFTAKPKKAFVTPFSWDDGEFRRNCNLVNGMVVDRYRLLLPARDGQNWTSPDLTARLVAWLEPRIARLPRP